MQTIEEVVSKYAKAIKEIIARAAHEVRTIQAQQMSDAFTKIAYGFGAAAAVKAPLQSVYSVLSEARAKKWARCPKPGLYVKA